ncbi:MAG: GT-D fold domain-containing glycosyltransferase [Clostridia bacterium]|nr:GT-D fold domain-containing glycosyltransferase [Clostridia bacterium]
MIKIKRIIAFILGIIKLIFTFTKSKTIVYDKVQSVTKAKTDRLSIIRFGDGEYRMIARKKDIHYQKYEPELREEMLKIIHEYDKSSNYLICIPRAVVVENAIWFLKHPIKYFTHFIDFRFYFRYFMDTKVEYGDAMMFASGNEVYYKEIWKDTDNIIFVHNSEKWANNFESKYNKKTVFIEVPSKNSYSEIDEIERNILEQIEKIGDNTYSILISSGPSAKCLVYRLAKKGIVAYDCGHCWDEPLVFVD